MAKLPKKYIKQAGGINKKAWSLYRASKKRKSPKRTKTNRRAPQMAKRKYTKKRVYRAARFGGGKFKPVIDGVAVGLIERFAGQYIPIPGAIKIGYGIFRSNQTITTLGALELGASFLGGMGANNGGGVR